MEKEGKKSRVCRVCLNCYPEEGDGTCLSIFEVVDGRPISDKINALASVNIKERDGLPDQICAACLLDLETAYNFKLRCESTNQKLLSALNSLMKYENKLPIKKRYPVRGSFTEADGDKYLDKNITLEPSVLPKPSKPIDKKLICDDCGDSFTSKCKIRVHWKKVHMHEKLKCPKCLRQFNTYTTFNRHQKKKSRNCIDAAQFHIEGVGKDRTYQCKQCNYRSQNIQTALIHMVVHTGEKRYKCKVCQKKFTQNAGLRVHMESVHLVNAVKIPCPYCDKQYQGRTNLNKHIRRVHNNIRFICKLCNAVLKSKDGLEAHSKIHSGIKEYVCELCAKTFTLKSYLLNHQKTVHDKSIKQFTCDICRYTSRLADRIKQHKIKHSPTNTACNVCGKFFENELQLSLHKKRHTERCYKCPLCDKTFYSRKYLCSHKRSKHRTKGARQTTCL